MRRKEEEEEEEGAAAREAPSARRGGARRRAADAPGYEPKAAWPPLGQQRARAEEEPRAWARRRADYIRDSMKWVNEHPGLMSFELWCVATG